MFTVNVVRNHPFGRLGAQSEPSLPMRSDWEVLLMTASSIDLDRRSWYCVYYFYICQAYICECQDRTNQNSIYLRECIDVFDDFDERVNERWSEHYLYNGNLIKSKQMRKRRMSTIANNLLHRPSEARRIPGVPSTF